MGSDAGVFPITWEYVVDGGVLPNSFARQREEARKALVAKGLLDKEAMISSKSVVEAAVTERTLFVETPDGQEYRAVAPLTNGIVKMEIYRE